MGILYRKQLFPMEMLYILHKCTVLKTALNQAKCETKGILYFLTAAENSWNHLIVILNKVKKDKHRNKILHFWNKDVWHQCDMENNVFTQNKDILLVLDTMNYKEEPTKDGKYLLQM